MGVPYSRRDVMIAGEDVRKGSCHQCGNRVDYRLMKDQTVHYRCGNLNDDGETCGFQARLGAYDSWKDRRKALIAEGRLQEVKVSKPANVNAPPAANTNDAPKTAPAKEKGGWDEYGF